MNKSIIHIFLLVALFSFTGNLIIKCDGMGILKAECHSDDCNKDRPSNEECFHCLTINNSAIFAPSQIIFNNTPQFFYSSYTNHYQFQKVDSFLRPPQA